MLQLPAALVGCLVVIARGAQQEQIRIMVTPGIQGGFEISQVVTKARGFEQHREHYKVGGLVFTPTAVSTLKLVQPIISPSIVTPAETVSALMSIFLSPLDAIVEIIATPIKFLIAPAAAPPYLPS